MRADERALAYGGGWLDRAGGLRGDPGWIAARLSDRESVLLPFWRDRCLVSAERVPVRPAAVDAAGLLTAADETVFLGLDAGRAIFAVDLSGRPEPEALALAGAVEAVDVRALVGGLEAAEAAVQAYAKGLLHWHRGQRHCGACGAVTEARDGGHTRSCTGPGCGRLLFPRIEPAVIVLVEAPDESGRCLLARHRGAPEGSWSTLAGFVEIGESLEDAVRRELAEEAGVTVSGMAYQGSQAWPFPAGLMVGFRATAASTEVRVDGEELVDARWFSREELRARVAEGRPLGRIDSIDRHLLGSWLDGRD
ncbi:MULTISPECIES: NAD(+) diphosphatase [Micromonospora]|uniref:NAD(+) diphosphatase n=1 Tax=Micromonospora solifontis TaxID=2487138 RepID=A0ABX9WAE5_9ACTN|nr:MULTISPECIES: NAD(+) diphosphatase [Micromonospora]NES16447.1 NAD(+) diphosphatase [Micromonospora sp. PPF5-17B]NES39620.1 NAD(+) diphosphatase [Micromonospora solifontis]NES58135.1 NAD(+) diphosphatase [Micromonospora sp. PPF5-6]RNL87909.1 NAD(+) diphosphatase [Micromonospora solifontis]